MEMLQYMHPAITFLIAWTNMWCIENNVKPVWTSWMRTAEQNRELNATDVHIYRAADLSVKREYGWNEAKRNRLLVEMRKKFNNIGAITRSGVGFKKKVILRHDSGHGDHFHIQVHPTADLSDIR